MLRITLKQKILLIIFSLILFAILIELGLRLGGFILLSLQEYRNRLALKQKGTYRILCLGESTTAPTGIEDYSYPLQLQEILSQRDIGISFSVINKGVSATNTSGILCQLESNLDKYRPDMIITMMGVNDYGEVLPYVDNLNDESRSFFMTLRVYKLANLLKLHIANKLQEIGFYKPKHSIRIDAITEKFDYNEQRDAFSKTTEIPAQDVQAYIDLGCHYRDQEKFTQAEEAFKKAIELAPENTNGYQGLAWCYRDQEKFPQAEAMYKKVIELVPQDAHGYCELAQCYHNQEKFPQAEAMYKKAIEIAPGSADAYGSLGCCYRDQGEFTQAEEAFKKAIELAPENTNGYQGLAWCYRDQGEFTQAEYFFKKAIEIDPTINNDLDRLYGALASLYQEQKKYKLAEKYFKKSNSLRLEYCKYKTNYNYRELKNILDKRNVILVCVQYPMRGIEPLKKIFQDTRGIIFVDNEKIFKEAVRKDNYNTYFRDSFGGEFGHCTPKGNRLLAENIANTILKDYFKID